MTEEPQRLVRSLGVGDVASLGLSSVVGSGIYMLPGLIAARMGPAGLVASLGAGVLCILVALCFAEVGSRFRGTGGAYLYAREAFGPFVGFQVGWMTWWTRVISWAALANAFAVALAGVVPALVGPWKTAAGLLVVLVLAGANLCGARAGATVMNVFTVAKLLPLLAFVLVGLAYVDTSQLVPFAPQGYGDLANSMLVILWAYVGFEVLAIPGGEMRDPQRDVPRALLLTMALVTVLYLAVQVVAIGTLPTLAGSENPVAEASQTMFGPWGGALVAVAIAVAMVGSNTVSALVTPRSLFSLAEQGQLPGVLARVHSDRGVPSVAILVSAVLVIVLTLSGSFEQLAVLSVVARFLQYLPTCLATIVLRRRDAAGAPCPAAGFRIPLGPVVPVLALVSCAALLSQADPDQLLAGGAFVLLGVPFYLAFGRSTG